MASFNKVILLGNCTRDPELRYTPKGTAVAEVGLAISEYHKDEAGNRDDRVVFVSVTLWGKTAEIAGEYLHKGDPVHIEGKLQLDSWADKTTGKTEYKLKVVGENIQLLGSPKKDRKPREERQAAKPQPGPARDPDLDAGDDDIPFN